MGGQHLRTTYNRLSTGAAPVRRIMTDDEKDKLFEDINYSLNTMIGLLVVSLLLQCVVLGFVGFYILSIIG